MRIKLNDQVSIDLNKLIESRALIQANSGGGKSWAIRRIIEQAFGHVQIIVIDPEGEFSNLRQEHDFVYIAKDGDARATVQSAALLAQRLMETKASAIIDLYEIPGERKAFVKAFLDALVNLPKELWQDCLIIIDECHQFAPEKDESMALQSVSNLASLGRKRGYCLIAASGRPAKLNKDVAAECNNKLIGRATLDVDRKRNADEIGLSDKKEILGLRNLEPGTFYTFGPAISRDVEIIEIGDIKVKPPKRGALKSAPPKPTAAVKQILAKLADLPKEAEKKAQTEADLKKENAQLKGEVTRLSRQQPAVEKSTTVIEKPVLKDSQIKSLERIAERMYKEAERHGTAMSLLWSNFDEIGKGLSGALEAISKFQKAPDRVSPASEPARRAADIIRSPLPSDASEGMTVPKQRILDALAWLASLGRDMAEKPQLAVLADQSPRSSGYTNNLGALRTAGLISYPSGGFVALTEAGRLIARVPDAPLTTEDVQDSVRRKVTRPQWAILEALIAVRPGDLAKAELAERSGQSASSSGYTNNLGALRSLGFLEYPQPGRVKAADLLFV